MKPYICDNCGETFEIAATATTCPKCREGTIFEREHKHSWVPYELEPRHQVNVDVADQAYIDTSRVTAFYVSKVKCVECGEERNLETPKGDVERQLELQRETGGENIG